MSEENTNELQILVKETIVQICEGIREAKEALNSNTFEVVAEPYGNRDIYLIDFDIAFSVETSKENSKNGGFNIKVVSTKGDANQSPLEQKTNRIKFSVPYSPSNL